MSTEPKPKYGFKFYFIAVVIIAICVFELIALFAWSKSGWLENMSALLAVIGLYGLALGFFSKIKALSELKEILTELTSPNPLVYIRGNVLFCVFISEIGARGCETRMESDCPNKRLWFLGLILWIPVAVILFVYIILHFCVIAPLTYIPMVVASAIVAKFNCSSGDDIVTIGDIKVSIKSIVKGDIATVKGFIIGIPSLAISFLSQVYITVV